MQIEDKTFLITGGGSGLGAATAERLVAEGGRVLVAEISPQSGQQIADQLGKNARFVQTDVTDPPGVDNAISVAQADMGGLHGVVHCAGIALAEKTLGKEGPHDLDRFQRLIQINLVGTFNVIRLAAAAIAGQRRIPGETQGVIVCTSSVAAFDGQVGQAAYAASKAGIAGMTLPIARDLARNAIRVMTIAPGLFDTPLMAGLPAAARESLAQQVPFPPRLGQPAEFAALVAHIIENDMLNGETIRLDAAIRMAPG